MFEEYENNIENRKAIIALLYKMVISDGHIAEIEKQYLKDIGRGIGLDPFMVDEVVKNHDQYELKSPPDEKTRMTILYYLLFMLRVDGRVDEREQKLLHEAGFRLGFNENMTTDLLGVMKQYAKEELPPDAMVDQVKKHLN